jgi:CRP-like cAMP-binding protein
MLEATEDLKRQSVDSGNGIAPHGTNALLDALPDSEKAMIAPQLRPVSLRSREMIAEAGTALDWVHFPTTCVISKVTVVDSGGIEALTVGREGVTGTHLLSGARTTFARVICQIPGDALQIPASEFVQLTGDLPQLKRRVLLYSQLSFDVTSQSAACNRLHVTEERCARWLLMSQDRADRDDFELTQAFLSQMLGVRRPAVTVAIGMLEKAGFIEHRRARIRITDRSGLESAACECYRLIRDRTRELMGT